jgi:hypothetical protein
MGRPSSNRLRPSASSHWFFTVTFVLLSGRKYKDQRYELAFGWVECTKNGDVCQAKRTHLFKFQLTPPEKFAKVNNYEVWMEV